MSIRRKPSDAEVEACLDFTPMPRIHNRYDGWTPERQRGFIAALARLGTVKAAAAHVAMSPEGAYHLRRQRGAEGFARAWARAHAAGVASLRDIAYERAIHGTPREVWHKGERVGTERRPNDRLLMFMLRREAPAAFGAPRLLAPGTRHPLTLAREAEWAAGPGDDAELWCDPDDPEGEAMQRREAAFARALDLYRIKIVTERRQRLAGDVVGADFALRQATILEVLLTAGAGARDLVAEIAPSYRGAAQDTPETYATPMARALADLRRKTWEEEAAPLRPELREQLGAGSNASTGGPTWQERSNAQKEANAIIARGQAMWEAAATEEGWTRWKRTDQPPLP